LAVPACPAVDRAAQGGAFRASRGGITWFPFYQARGAPRKFLADVREQTAEVALSSPKVLIGMNQWSVPKLRGI
jgi:hypothetical protein